LLSVKVLDFGISKITTRGSVADMGHTKTQAVMGSPLYMSPEQMESTRNVDARTDIWALGVVLYELLTGNLPFLAESMPELVTRILKFPPEPISTYRTDLPEGLEAVIANCLQKDRADRYPNVAKFAHALLPFGPKRGRQHVDRITRTIVNAGISDSAIAFPQLADTAPPPPGRSTKASWGRTSGGSTAPRMTALYVAGGVIGVVGLVFVLRPGPTVPAAEPQSPERVAPAAPPPVAAAPSAAAEPAVPVTPVVSAVPVAAPSAAPEPAKSTPQQVPAGAAAKPRPAIAAKPAPVKPSAAPAPTKPKTNLYDDRK